MARTFVLCTFSLSAYNAGPSPASNVVLTNTLPAGFTFVSSSSGQLLCTNLGSEVICTAASLPVGATAATTLSTRAGGSGTATNRASVFGDEFDVNLTNNSIALSFQVSPPRLSVWGTTVTEIPGGTNATITLGLSSSNDVPVIVSLQTTNGSALASLDYLGTDALVVIPPGVLTQLVSVLVLDDALDETNETFGVVLQNFTNAVAGTPSSATVTIVDDDLPALAWVRAGAGLQFEWTGNYVLQSNSVLQSSGWTNLPGQSPLLIPILSGRSAFFRLTSPP